MSILKIARMGHPVLTTPALPVADPAAPDIQRLIADMIETMEDASGAGLAAPQVHVGLRLFVFRVPATRSSGAEDDAEMPTQVLINPSLAPIGEQTEPGWEGCLSIPGLRAAVPRFRQIRYQGLDASGAPVQREASGFHARVVQHEYDHLDGILYPMRLTDFRLFGFDDELSRALRG